MLPFKKYTNIKNKTCKHCKKVLILEELEYNNSKEVIEEAKYNCNGYILYHGPNYVCIGTGFVTDSKNEKTGDMIQICIIRSDMHPVEAIEKGSDATICFNCKHRGTSCYVNVGQSIGNIYKSYTKGNYPFICKDPQNMKKFDDIDYYIENGFWDLFSGKNVRFGSYGDPVRIPFPIVAKIAESCDGFTGYTHQWDNDVFSAYKKYFMASCDTLNEYKRAKEKGWRTFRVTSEWRIKHPDETACLYSVDGTQCVNCLACAGTSSSEKDIYVKAHGPSWKVNEFLKNFNEPSLNIKLTPEEEKQIQDIEKREQEPQLAEAAISVYNNWDQNDDGHSEEYGSGGICDKVAEEMASTFEDLKPEELKNWYGFTFYKDWQCHTDFYIVNHEIDAMMEIGLHPSFYETGGGYTWKKNKEHNISKDAFHIDTGFNYEDYFDDNGEMKGY